MAAKIPPMDELIEDYGYKTQDLCQLCRLSRVPRFYFLYQVTVEEASPKKPREFFTVCPYCDVEVSAR